MNDSVTLKLARRDDAISIARMSTALIEYGLSPAWTPERVASHIRRPESAVLIARGDEQVLGFAIMEFGDRTAHLNLLAVSTLARRRGIGRQMLSWLHESAIVAGTFLIKLELRASNHTALEFYRRMGYLQSGFVRGYYSGVEDAICMSRDLTTKEKIDE